MHGIKALSAGCDALDERHATGGAGRWVGIECGLPLRLADRHDEAVQRVAEVKQRVAVGTDQIAGMTLIATALTRPGMSCPSGSNATTFGLIVFSSTSRWAMPTIRAVSAFMPLK